MLSLPLLFSGIDTPNPCLVILKGNAHKGEKMRTRTEKDIETIKQKKLDSLAVKHLHVKRLTKLGRLIQAIDLLGFAVPILYIPVRFIAKGTNNEFLAEGIWSFLAAILMVLALAKLAFQWQRNFQRHSELLGENISLIGQADRLLAEPEKLTTERIELFLMMAGKSEKDDRFILGEPSMADKQFAYREALKEISPGDINITCPVCKASPYKFRPGLCQTCGNTPVDNIEKQELK